jgi:hypothetical protein
MALPFLFLLPSQLPFELFYQEKKFKSEEFRKEEATKPPASG